MTLDEAIKHCEEVIEELEKEAQEWHENQVRKCKLIPFAEMDYTHENDCIECAREHKQLAEWLKELKKFREQQPYEKFESTKDHIYKLAGDYKCWDNRLTEDEAVELCHILEQEPCEDVISRAEALKVVDDMDIPEDMSVFEIKSHIGVEIGTLPPATPKRKVGEWIKKNNDYFDWYECSECGYGSDGEMKYNRLCDVRTKFCPNCGEKKENEE